MPISPADHRGRKSPIPGRRGRKRRNRCTPPDRYRAILRSHAEVRPSWGGCNPPGTRPRKPCPSSRCRVPRLHRSWYVCLLKHSADLKRTKDSSKNPAKGTARNSCSCKPGPSPGFPPVRALRLRQRARQIHLPRSAATWEVPVLSTDHHLVRPRRYPRACVDAGAATWLDHVCPGFLKYLEVALINTVLPCLLGAELNVEFDRFRHPFAVLQSVGEHFGVHIHVFILARRTGSTIGELYWHGRIQIANILAIPRIARRRHHGRDFSRVQLNHFRILRITVARESPNHLCRFTPAHTPAFDEELDHLVIGRHDPGEPANLGCHVRHGSSLVHA